LEEDVKPGNELPVWARKMLAFAAFAAVALAGASCAGRSDAGDASRIESSSSPPKLEVAAHVDVTARMRSTD